MGFGPLLILNGFFNEYQQGNPQTVKKQRREEEKNNNFFS